MLAFFNALLVRDLRMAMRRRSEALLPIGFFIIAVALFPLGIGPEPQTLRSIAPGLVWVCALLATMLSASQRYTSDHADGTLDQLMMGGQDSVAIAVVVAAARSAAHWALTGLPLVIAAPLFGRMFDLAPPSVAMLAFTLLLGTPLLSLLGSVGSALTLSLRSAGVLVIPIVLPLPVPALIFGTGAVAAVAGGPSPAGLCSMLGALLIFTLLTAPLASAAALRLAVE